MILDVVHDSVQSQNGNRCDVYNASAALPQMTKKSECTVMTNHSCTSSRIDRSDTSSGVDNDKWTGYINKSSGWADAGASVELYFKRAVSRPNVRFIQAEVRNYDDVHDVIMTYEM